MAKAITDANLNGTDLMLKTDEDAVVALAHKMIRLGQFAQNVMEGSRKMRTNGRFTHAEEAGSLADLLREVVRLGFALRNAMAVHYPEE